MAYAQATDNDQQQPPRQTGERREAGMDGIAEQNWGAYWPALLCLAAGAGLTAAEVNGWRRAQWLLKPAASGLFVVQALLLGAAGSGYGLLILLALGLCLIGDVLLIPRGNDALFKAGIGAFLAGHLAFIAAFLAVPLPGGSFLTGAVVMLALTGPYLFYIWPQLVSDFRIPVGAYTLVIAVMIVTAFGSGRWWQVPLAAVMFAGSDMLVGRDRFVREERWHALVITPLYYGAQVLFATSV